MRTSAHPTGPTRRATHRRARISTLAALALSASVALPAVARADATSPSDDKTSWTVTDFPTPFAGLSSIAVNGSATVTVGFRIAPPFRFTPLAAAWDGTHWTRQHVRLDTDATEVQLTDVDLQSPTRGWTVGRGFGGAGSGAVTARWNGKNWKGVPTDQLTGDIGFAGVAAVGRKNVWAVGQEQVGATLKGTIAHYDGHSWTHVDVPPLEDVGDYTALSSVAAAADGTLWAVGLGGVSLRYDGSAWEQVTMPKIAGQYIDLQRVRSLASSGVWAVGYALVDHARLPVALHWDGKKWQTVQVPAGDRAQLDDVSETADGVVAIGYRDDVTQFYGLRLDLDGPAQALKLPEGDDALFGAASNDDGTVLWVVGSGSVGSEGKIAPYAAVRS